jgi:mono/diheme cytochrome c family protein
MRERWSRWLAALTGTLVLLLSAAVAWQQNRAPQPERLRPTAAAALPLAAAEDAALARGRALFDSEGCVRCHSVDGHGSPRSPLDGVGGELDGDELWQWVVGDEAVADGLSSRALAAKQSYRGMPATDREALLAWLQSLR